MKKRQVIAWEQQSKNVKELGEVYTSDDIVTKILELIKDDSVDATYLEPSCGDGQFLIRILWNKLNNIKVPNELDILKAVCSIYGVDIQPDKVEQSRNRMYNLLGGFPVETFDINGNIIEIKRPFEFNITPEFERVLDYILNTNIQVGNTLEENSDLALTEYKFNGRSVTTTEYWLTKHKGLNEFFMEVTYEPLKGVKQEYNETDYLHIPDRIKKTGDINSIEDDAIEGYDF